jgi:hypothetical protein
VTRDYVVLAAAVLAFAALITVHCSLVVGLMRRRSVGRGLTALVVPPLAPLWGWRSRMRVRGTIWLMACASYAVALGLAFAR